MYVSLVDFEQNVGKYMMLAKKVDLFIVDSTNTTVWTLRCRQNTLQARLAKVFGDACGAELCTMPSTEGYYSCDSCEPSHDFRRTLPTHGRAVHTRFRRVDYLSSVWL